MVDQASSDLVPGDAGLAPAAMQPSGEYHRQGHHGRPISWAGVATIMAGFIAGSIGLVAGPTWWLFWAGAAVAAVGGILALGAGIMDDWY